jgi:hypothetical protein
MQTVAKITKKEYKAKTVGGINFYCKIRLTPDLFLTTNEHEWKRMSDG